MDRRAIRASAMPLFAIRPSGLMRHGLFVAAVTASLLIADALQEILPGGGVFLVLLLPVLLGAAALGTGAAAVALGVGAVGALLLTTVRGHPWLSEPSDLSRLVLYGIEGATMIAIIRVARRPSRARTHPVSPSPQSKVSPAIRLIEPLTTREAQVLRLLAAGNGTEAIGAQLCLSRNTVKSHLRHAYGKVGAHNQAEAIAASLRLGCIDVSELPGPAPYLAVQEGRGSTRGC